MTVLESRRRRSIRPWRETGADRLRQWQSQAAAVGVGLLWLGTAAPAFAQVRASERGSVSQIIDGTLIEVSYGRPQLRGRIAFGGVVHWNEMWTPGANWATTLSASKSIRLNGRAVPAGTYSVWVVPTPTTWTFHLHPDPKRYHLQRPRPDEMTVAIPVSPEQGPSVERLTFSFPELRRDGATLRFEWGTTALSLRIDVEATAPRRPARPAQAVAAYLGDYAAWSFAENGDSTASRFRLVHEGGRLVGQMNDGGRFEMFPTRTLHQFWYEAHDREGPRDVELDGPVTFTVDRSGRATGFRMPGKEQALWWRGTRTDR
ncbi:MAG: DUF2911 domain-containing protein [Gemmatimonadales bacterium]